MQNKHYYKAIALLLMTALASSLMAAGAKYVSGFASVHVLIAVQYAFGLLVLTPYFIRGGVSQLKTTRLKLHALRGLSGLLAFYAYYYAIQHVSLLEASLLRNSAPLCLPLIAMIGVKATISTKRWLVLIIGFVGVAMILRPAPDTMNVWYFVAFLSAIFLALSMLTTRLLIATETPVAIMFYYFIISLVCALPGAIIHYDSLSNYQWAVMFLVSSSFYLAMSFYTRAFQYAKATILAPFTYFGVIFAGILGWIFWGQVPSLITYVGVVLVVGAALISVRIDRV